MKIWHVGASNNPFEVNGINQRVWTLAQYQAAGGHIVAILVAEEPENWVKEWARAHEIRVHYVSGSKLLFNTAALEDLIRRDRPDIVHMHSAFVPRQAQLAELLKKYGIAYVVTPGGGYAPQVLARGRLKKWLYGCMVERRRIRNAKGLSYVAPGELRELMDYVPGYSGSLRWIPNPVSKEVADADRHATPWDHKRLVFLGRFDVIHKGLDRLIRIVRLLPQWPVVLYGVPDRRTLDLWKRLVLELPPNVQIHEPVFGRDKVQALIETRLYIHLSRWEAFGISIAEALYLGVPVAVASEMHLAPLIAQHGLGLVVDADQPERAAQILEHYLSDRDWIRETSARARDWARTHFHPQAVAEAYLDWYREVLM